MAVSFVGGSASTDAEGPSGAANGMAARRSANSSAVRAVGVVSALKISSSDAPSAAPVGSKSLACDDHDDDGDDKKLYKSKERRRTMSALLMTRCMQCHDDVMRIVTMMIMM